MAGLLLLCQARLALCGFRFVAVRTCERVVGPEIRGPIGRGLLLEGRRGAENASFVVGEVSASGDRSFLAGAELAGRTSSAGSVAADGLLVGGGWC